MATDLSSAISTILPSKQTLLSGTATSFYWFGIFIVIFIILILGGVGVWIIVRSLQFNKKIDIYEELNGVPQYIGKDRAREVVYSKMGDSVFYLKKRKKYLPRGEIKISKNRYMYLIRSDGEWVNAGLEAFNSKLKTMGINPIHPDMRAFKDGMDKMMEKSFLKKSLLKDMLPIIIPIILFIIVGLILYFIADRLVAFLDKLPVVVETMNKVLDKADQVLNGVSNVCANSGVK